MLSLIRYANWHIRRYRQRYSTLELAIIFAFHCLVACVTFSMGILATPVNSALVSYGISLLAVTLYIHRPNIRNL
jgi:uncharacterized membrane protein (DUF485 family)